MTPRVKLVVDSTGDIPAEWLNRWDISVIPAYVNFEDKSFADDGVSLSREEFYRRLAASRSLPRTSAPPPGVAQDILRKQLEKAEHVVAFTVASQFSGIYNTVQLAAQNVDPQRITVYNSGTLAMSLGWLVIAAAEAAEQGADVKEVLDVVEKTRKRTHLWAAIDTLEYLRRSGRINPVIASLGTLLQIKPIIDVKDGAVTIVQRVRTMSKAVQALIDTVRRNAPIERIALLHTNYRKGAEDLKVQLADILPAESIIVEATPVIGTHVGPGCVGVALVQKQQ
jgi:DegV family protein with EDD domain